jgi:predicted lipoprotein with Yx(FWY)xxD motif
MGTSSSSGGMSKTATLTIKDTKIGNVLADSKGQTIYWYSKDMKGGPSTCTGSCLSAWPMVTGTPVAAMGVKFAGKLGAVKNATGVMQATYNGYPLYTYSGDMASGDTSGNGVGGVWHVISGQYLTASTSSGSGSMSGSSGSGSSGSGYSYGASQTSGSSSIGSTSGTSGGSGGSSGGSGGSSGGSGGSSGGTSSTVNSASKSAPAPAPTPSPTSSVNGGGCGDGSCW